MDSSLKWTTSVAGRNPGADVASDPSHSSPAPTSKTSTDSRGNSSRCSLAIRRVESVTDDNNHDDVDGGGEGSTSVSDLTIVTLRTDRVIERHQSR